MSKNNGGPAFPAVCEWDATAGIWKPTEAGMTLRDYFAAKAMASWIGDATTLAGVRKGAEKQNIEEAVLIARAAYEMADAMLKERAK